LVGIIDGEGKRVFKKRVPNDPQLVRDVLKPYKGEIVAIAVESTYNWYWMVDTLVEEGYRVHLANPAATPFLLLQPHKKEFLLSLDVHFVFVLLISSPNP
jgi:hypothetical protein